MGNLDDKDIYLHTCKELRSIFYIEILRFENFREINMPYLNIRQNDVIVNHKTNFKISKPDLLSGPYQEKLKIEQTVVISSSSTCGALWVDSMEIAKKSEWSKISLEKDHGVVKYQVATATMEDEDGDDFASEDIVNLGIINHNATLRSYIGHNRIVQETVERVIKELNAKITKQDKERKILKKEEEDFCPDL